MDQDVKWFFVCVFFIFSFGSGSNFKIPARNETEGDISIWNEEPVNRIVAAPKGDLHIHVKNLIILHDWDNYKNSILEKISVNTNNSKLSFNHLFLKPISKRIKKIVSEYFSYFKTNTRDEIKIYLQRNKIEKSLEKQLGKKGVELEEYFTFSLKPLEDIFIHADNVIYNATVHCNKRKCKIFKNKSELNFTKKCDPLEEEREKNQITKMPSINILLNSTTYQFTDSKSEENAPPTLPSFFEDLFNKKGPIIKPSKPAPFDYFDSNSDSSDYSQEDFTDPLYKPKKKIQPKKLLEMFEKTLLEKLEEMNEEMESEENSDEDYYEYPEETKYEGSWFPITKPNHKKIPKRLKDYIMESNSMENPYKLPQKRPHKHRPLIFTSEFLSSEEIDDPFDRVRPPPKLLIPASEPDSKYPDSEELYELPNKYFKPLKNPTDLLKLIGTEKDPFKNPSSSSESEESKQQIIFPYTFPPPKSPLVSSSESESKEIIFLNPKKPSELLAAVDSMGIESSESSWSKPSRPKPNGKYKEDPFIYYESASYEDYKYSDSDSDESDSDSDSDSTDQWNHLKKKPQTFDNSGESSESISMGGIWKPLNVPKKDYLLSNSIDSSGSLDSVGQLWKPQTPWDDESDIKIIEYPFKPKYSSETDESISLPDIWNKPKRKPKPDSASDSAKRPWFQEDSGYSSESYSDSDPLNLFHKHKRPHKKPWEVSSSESEEDSLSLFHPHNHKKRPPKKGFHPFMGSESSSDESEEGLDSQFIGPLNEKDFNKYRSSESDSESEERYKVKIPKGKPYRSSSSSESTESDELEIPLTSKEYKKIQSILSEFDLKPKTDKYKKPSLLGPQELDSYYGTDEDSSSDISPEYSSDSDSDEFWSVKKPKKPSWVSESESSEEEDWFKPSRVPTKTELESESESESDEDWFKPSKHRPIKSSESSESEEDWFRPITPRPKPKKPSIWSIESSEKDLDSDLISTESDETWYRPSKKRPIVNKKQPFDYSIQQSFSYESGSSEEDWWKPNKVPKKTEPEESIESDESSDWFKPSKHRPPKKPSILSIGSSESESSEEDWFKPKPKPKRPKKKPSTWSSEEDSDMLVLDEASLEPYFEDGLEPTLPKGEKYPWESSSEESSEESVSDSDTDTDSESESESESSEEDWWKPSKHRPKKKKPSVWSSESESSEEDWFKPSKHRPKKKKPSVWSSESESSEEDWWSPKKHRPIKDKVKKGPSIWSSESESTEEDWFQPKKSPWSIESESESESDEDWFRPSKHRPTSIGSIQVESESESESESSEEDWFKPKKPKKGKKPSIWSTSSSESESESESSEEDWFKPKRPKKSKRPSIWSSDSSESLEDDWSSASESISDSESESSEEDDWFKPKKTKRPSIWSPESESISESSSEEDWFKPHKKHPKKSKKPSIWSPESSESESSEEDWFKPKKRPKKTKKPSIWSLESSESESSEEDWFKPKKHPKKTKKPSIWSLESSESESSEEDWFKPKKRPKKTKKPSIWSPESSESESSEEDWFKPKKRPKKTKKPSIWSLESSESESESSEEDWFKPKKRPKKTKKPSIWSLESSESESESSEEDWFKPKKRPKKTKKPVAEISVESLSESSSESEEDWFKPKKHPKKTKKPSFWSSESESSEEDWWRPKKRPSYWSESSSESESSEEDSRFPQIDKPDRHPIETIPIKTPDLSSSEEDLYDEYGDVLKPVPIEEYYSDEESSESESEPDKKGKNVPLKNILSSPHSIESDESLLSYSVSYSDYSDSEEMAEIVPVNIVPYKNKKKRPSVVSISSDYYSDSDESFSSEEDYFSYLPLDKKKKKHPKYSFSSESDESSVFYEYFDDDDDDIVYTTPPVSSEEYFSESSDSDSDEYIVPLKSTKFKKNKSKFDPFSWLHRDTKLSRKSTEGDDSVESVILPNTKRANAPKNEQTIKIKHKFKPEHLRPLFHARPPHKKHHKKHHSHHKKNKPETESNILDLILEASHPSSSETQEDPFKSKEKYSLLHFSEEERGRPKKENIILSTSDLDTSGEPCNHYKQQKLKICMEVGTQRSIRSEDSKIIIRDDIYYRCNGDVIKSRNGKMKCRHGILVEIYQPCSKFSVQDNKVCIGKDSQMVCDESSNCVCYGGLDSIMVSTSKHRDMCAKQWKPSAARHKCGNKSNKKLN